MIKYLFSTLLIAGITLCSFQAFSQIDSSKEKESIILRKEGTFPKDLTIHIHGDEITINGKVPKDIDVIRKKSSESNRRFRSYNRSFKGKNMPKTFSHRQGERALLGVITGKDDESQGAKIIDVEKGTAADSAGLKEGDVIVKIDNQKIASPMELSKTIRRYAPGKAITVTYLRDGKTHTSHISLGRISGGMQRGALGGRNPSFGYRMPPNGNNLMEWFRNHHPQMLDRNPNIRMSPRSKGKLGVVVENNKQPNGAKIIHVSPNTAAAKAGFEKNDIITKFGKMKIGSVENLKQAIKEDVGKESIKVVVKRGNKEKSLSVSLEGNKGRTSL